jgi:hypothetical protein
MKETKVPAQISTHSCDLKSMTLTTRPWMPFVHIISKKELTIAHSQQEILPCIIEYLLK